MEIELPPSSLMTTEEALDLSMQNELLIWTVYFDPVDFPGKYVARPFICLDDRCRAVPQHLLADTLENLREQLPPHLTSLGRREGDDPVIVEVWI